MRNSSARHSANPTVVPDGFFVARSYDFGNTHRQGVERLRVFFGRCWAFAALAAALGGVIRWTVSCNTDQAREAPSAPASTPSLVDRVARSIVQASPVADPADRHALEDASEKLGQCH